MLERELTRQQRKIDYIYQRQLDIIRIGLENHNGDYISVGAMKANLVVDIMEALRLHSKSHCIGLRATIAEMKGKGNDYEYS